MAELQKRVRTRDRPVAGACFAVKVGQGKIRFPLESVRKQLQKAFNQIQKPFN